MGHYCFPERNTLAESGPKLDKFNTSATCLSPDLNTFFSPPKIPFFSTMPEISLTVYAARIEAAVASYVKIRDFADTNLWREAFEKEKVNSSFRRLDLIPICYRRGLRRNLRA